MHPHDQHGQRFWEEVRLLESVVQDIRDESELEQVKRINWFLNEQCNVLSVGHKKCRQMLEDNPVLPAYESLEDFEKDNPHVVGCYGCGEMYETSSDAMPSDFERLRDKGVIEAGSYNYSRTIETQ